MLREKYKDEFAKVSVETTKQNTEKRAAADKEWLPKQQAWLSASRALDKSLSAGQFPGPDGGQKLDPYGPVGKASKVVAVSLDDGAQAIAFRKELTKDERWSKPFECRLIGAARALVAPNSKTKAALKASGASATVAEIDQLSCIVEDGLSPNLAVVIEVPVNTARAKVTVSGDEGTVTGYELKPSVGLDPEIAKALAEKSGASLKDRKIRVSGVSKLFRAESGALGYKMLTERKMENALAVRTAEYKKVWVASFERACADEGLACKLDDGRAAPEVKLLPPEPPTEKPAVAVVREERKLGRWEAAAHDAEPNLDDPNSSHDDPWGNGFFVNLIDKGAKVAGFDAIGKPVKTSSWPAEDGPLLTAFRTSLAKRGGAETFVCTVRDMGQEINPDPVALRDAALKAKGQTSKEGPTWIIVCEGDEKSHLGTVALFVPTDAIWAVLEGSTVKDYHVEPHGFFHKDLRDILIDVGIGTKLEITGYPRLARSMLKNVIFRKEHSFPVWRAYFSSFQCGHEGMGCTHLDGLKPEIRVAKDGLVKCPVSTWVYPPK